MATTDIVHKLDGLSRSLDRSWNYEYPETHAGQIEKITQGIVAADCGEWVAHDDLMRGMEELMGCKNEHS